MLPLTFSECHYFQVSVSVFIYTFVQLSNILKHYWKHFFMLISVCHDIDVNVLKLCLKSFVILSRIGSDNVHAVIVINVTVPLRTICAIRKY
jgi:hypothetical protein